jgi:nucleoside-diphosphate-sugar epimerase
MQISLTGFSGFIGQNLSAYLKAHQISVNGISRLQLHQIGANDLVNTTALVHLAGKAHDVKQTFNTDEYYHVNFELTKQLFDAFMLSDAKTFVFISSVKAAADSLAVALIEEHAVNPQTHYGKSKLMAETYLLDQTLSNDKRLFILRPCMVHGPGNKGNLNLLFKIVNKGFPWPLGNFENQRSFCSIDNLCFVINEILQNENIPSGIYNIADDKPISTNQLIRLIGNSQNKNVNILRISKTLILTIVKLGDFFKLSLNSERLQKLTENYVVSNEKIVNAIGKPLPLKTEEGLFLTFKSFRK